jgi:hypothetical protein
MKAQLVTALVANMKFLVNIFFCYVHIP